ncbi:MAG TPA: VOC family protein [Marmoricola sp.]|nr:VOC family protein [Marmoricola sp.]
MSGRVVHFEIPFDNAERARAFYFAAFGWELVPLQAVDYTLVLTGPSGDQGPSQPGFVNGGLARRSTDLRTPTVVVDVDDLDAALVEISELGGSTVAGRQQVGDLGYAAYVRDSEGNLLGLWESRRNG